MKMTNKDYDEYVKKKSPKSPMFLDVLKAFSVGGLICCIGQAISCGYEKIFTLNTTDAASAASITLIFLSALLTGIGLYGKIAKFAGAGTLVPITGFANAVAAPALEFKTEGFVTGMAAKMFTIAGPVIVYGISSSVIYGIILVILQYV